MDIGTVCIFDTLHAMIRLSASNRGAALQGGFSLFTYFLSQCFQFPPDRLQLLSSPNGVTDDYDTNRPKKNNHNADILRRIGVFYFPLILSIFSSMRLRRLQIYHRIAIRTAKQKVKNHPSALP